MNLLTELENARLDPYYDGNDLCVAVRDESHRILRKYPLALKRAEIFRPSNGGGPRTYRIKDSRK